MIDSPASVCGCIADPELPNAAIVRPDSAVPSHEHRGTLHAAVSNRRRELESRTHPRIAAGATDPGDHPEGRTPAALWARPGYLGNDPLDHLHLRRPIGKIQVLIRPTAIQIPPTVPAAVGIGVDPRDDAYRISDVLWEQIGPLLPAPTPLPPGRHRPRVSNRAAMNAILLVDGLQTGGRRPARDLPNVGRSFAARLLWRLAITGVGGRLRGTVPVVR